MLRQVVAILEQRPSGGDYWLWRTGSGQTAARKAVSHPNPDFANGLPLSRRWAPNPTGQLLLFSCTV